LEFFAGGTGFVMPEVEFIARVFPNQNESLSIDGATQPWYHLCRTWWSDRTSVCFHCVSLDFHCVFIVFLCVFFLLLLLLFLLLSKEKIVVLT